MVSLETVITIVSLVKTQIVKNAMEQDKLIVRYVKIHFLNMKMVLVNLNVIQTMECL